MDNNDHLEILSKGVKFWNNWRSENPRIVPDIRRDDIRRAIADAIGTWDSEDTISYPGINLSHMNFFQVSLEGINLRKADFTGAILYEADLSYAKLEKAKLNSCTLRKAYMSYAKLQGAELINSNLNRTNLVHADLSGATIENCIVYGVSAWGLITDEHTRQRNLILIDETKMGKGLVDYLNDPNKYPLMVDDIEIAQFIHLVTNYKNFGKALTAMLDKGILILGKFRDGGKDILLHIADQLRTHNFLPIIFDFSSPGENALIETVTVLAGISRFVIVDLSGPSVPAELERITSTYTRPVISFCKKEEEKIIYAMFIDILRKKEVLFLKYGSLDELDQKLSVKLKEAENLMHELIIDRNKEVLNKIAAG